MQLQLIRNATMRITYADHLFVADPFLAAKHAMPSFGGKSRNPTVELPCTPEEVIADVEMVIVSHLHGDHFDELAQQMLSKDIPIFCQPGDETTIAGHGFQDVTPVQDSVEWQGIQFTRTRGHHGSGAILERMGDVSGFVFRAEGEPVVYWAGDSIWYEETKKAVAESQPDIIITHSSGSSIQGSPPIVMDAEQTVAVCQAAPQAVVIAIHMEALDHGMVSRVDLRTTADGQGIQTERLLIPEDGEQLDL